MRHGRKAISTDMNAQRPQGAIHEQWSSRFAFVLAATGAAVGLGNIWKFPYIAGEHGGSVFVLVYILCVAVLGVPIMMAEVMLGRRGGRTPINSLRRLAAESHASRGWQIIGWCGTIVGILILSYYSVIAGWTIAYIPHAVTGAFSGFTGDSASTLFTHSIVENPLVQISCHTLFMVMTMAIVARGVHRGLEQAIVYLMPTLVVLLLILVGYAASTGYFMDALTFLFTPDFSKFSSTSILTAMGHAFFTLSLGMGAIMTYGIYLPKDTSIAGTSAAIAVADTMVALIAGMAIFPIVFANGLDPAVGPRLIFETVPVAFGNMAGGTFFGALFFLLLLIAAWTSSISLLEPAVTLLMENVGMPRPKAVCCVGLVIWILGFGTAFSSNIWSHITLFGLTIFEQIDYLTSNLMLPLGGLGIAIFAGWVVTRDASRAELNIRGTVGYSVWQFFIRWIAPVTVSIVLLHAIGMI